MPQAIRSCKPLAPVHEIQISLLKISAANVAWPSSNRLGLEGNWYSCIQLASDKKEISQKDEYDNVLLPNIDYFTYLSNIYLLLLDFKAIPLCIYYFWLYEYFGDFFPKLFSDLFYFLYFTNYNTLNC